MDNIISECTLVLNIVINYYVLKFYIIIYFYVINAHTVQYIFGKINEQLFYNIKDKYLSS